MVLANLALLQKLAPTGNVAVHMDRVSRANAALSTALVEQLQTIVKLAANPLLELARVPRLLRLRRPRRRLLQLLRHQAKSALILPAGRIRLENTGVLEVLVARNTDRVEQTSITVALAVRVHLEPAILHHLQAASARIQRVVQILLENTDVLEMPAVLSTDRVEQILITVELAVKAHSALALLLQDSLVQIQRVAPIRQGSILALEMHVARSTARVEQILITVVQAVKAHLGPVIPLQLQAASARIQRVVQTLQETTSAPIQPAALNMGRVAKPQLTVVLDVKAPLVFALPHRLVVALAPIRLADQILSGSIGVLELNAALSMDPAEILSITVALAARALLALALLQPVVSALTLLAVQTLSDSIGVLELTAARNMVRAEPLQLTVVPDVNVHSELVPLLQLLAVLALIPLADQIPSGSIGVLELTAALNMAHVGPLLITVVLAARLRSGLATVPRHHHRRPLLFLYHHQLLQVRRILPSTLRWPQPFRPGVLQMGISH